MDRQTGVSMSLLAAGSLFFPTLFFSFQQTLRQTAGWSHADASTVSARLVSSVHALMASSAGVIIASSCRDIVEDKHWLTDAYILFATPYFAFDIYAMFLCYRHRLQVKGHEEAVGSGGAVVWGYLRRESLLVLHHLFMVFPCFPATVFFRQGKGDYFQGVLLLAELSTPSVCLGKLLIQFNQQHTLLHKLNGVFMIVIFFTCRVLLFPYLYYTYSRYISVPVYLAPLLVPWQLNLIAALLMLLQIHWFCLICRGALRQLRPASTPPRPGRREPASTPPRPGREPASTPPSPGRREPASTPPRPGRREPASTPPSPGRREPATTPPSPGRREPQDCPHDGEPGGESPADQEGDQLTSRVRNGCHARKTKPCQEG